MKIILYILLIFSVVLPSEAAKKKTLFFLSYSIEGDSSSVDAGGTPAVFLTLMSDALLKEFPCAEYNSINVVRDMLGLQKQQELLGTSAKESIKNVGEAMGSDYLIILTIKAYPNDVYYYKAVCFDINNINKNKKYDDPIAQAIGNTSKDPNSFFQVLQDMSDKMIDQLASYEICPYKGPVNIQVVTEKKEDKKEEYDVYCSKMDRKYSKTTEEEKKSEAIWDLQKIKKDASSGTINYTMAEKTAIDEIDECYKCDPLTSGRHAYHEVTTSFLEIQDLSKESKSEGENVADCRITINFMKDGTYTLLVKASSQTGEKHILKQRSATGDCDLINDPPEDYTQKDDIGIREILGPFEGTGKDKVLEEKQTIERVDPVTKEKLTIRVDFHLSRE